MAFPFICEIPFSNVLIIDNERDEIKALKADFENRHISVIYAKDSKEAESILKLRPELSLVILDWLLDESTDIEAKRLLQLLKCSTFAPVIVYTDKSVIGPNDYIKQSGLNRIAKALNKDDVKCEKVFENINQWLVENPELRIFLRWDYEVEKRKNETLWAVHDLEIGPLRALIELLEPPDGSFHTTRERDLVVFLGRILTRKLDEDESFSKSIKTEVDELLTRQHNPVDVDKLGIFHTFERYRQANPESLWTGSILRNSIGNFYVVVTPACDLCNNKTERVILIKAEPLKQYGAARDLGEGKLKECITHKIAAVHYLPYAAGSPDGLVCRFDRIYTWKPQTLKKLLTQKKMTCVVIVDSPFIEHLIQRMNAYLMRLGVRDLNDGEITKLSRDAAIR